MFLLQKFFLKGTVMNYTEIDTSKSAVKWDMTFLHSHSYYEIYFLVYKSAPVVHALEFEAGLYGGE